MPTSLNKIKFQRGVDCRGLEGWIPCGITNAFCLEDSNVFAHDLFEHFDSRFGMFDEFVAFGAYLITRGLSELDCMSIDIQVVLEDICRDSSSLSLPVLPDFALNSSQKTLVAKCLPHLQEGLSFFKSSIHGGWGQDGDFSDQEIIKGTKMLKEISVELLESLVSFGVFLASLRFKGFSTEEIANAFESAKQAFVLFESKALSLNSFEASLQKNLTVLID